MKSDINVLIVEDEKIPALYLKKFLKKHNYNVIGVCDKGADAIDVACSKKPDIILMDVMLKDNISGAEAALKISDRIDTKIVFLTAYSDPEMLDYAVEAHASGYIIKPYNDKQILATLKLVSAKEVKHKTDNKVWLSNKIYYNLDEKVAYKDNKEIELSNKCASLLYYLVKHKNRTVKKEELCYFIYNEDKRSSTLRTLIYRLKNSIGIDLIKNISGVGYKIDEKNF